MLDSYCHLLRVNYAVSVRCQINPYPANVENIVSS
jgi:hypothetical protein